MNPVNTLTLQEARDHLARRACGKASKKKGDAWESEVIAKAKASGWLVHHVRPARTAQGWRSPISGHKGFPDLVLAHTHHGVLFVELKSGKDASLSPEQRLWHETLEMDLLDVKVWRPEARAEIYRTLEGR